VIVVENNSEDGSGDMAASEFPLVRLLSQSQNLGFTGGHNLAIAERKGRHAFLLNSDATVHPGCLASLLAFAESHPEVGIVGPKVLNPDGTLQMSCRRFPNPIAAMFRSTIFGRLFPNNRFTRDYLMADWDHSKTTEVDWVSGCAMLATKSFIETVGPMDPAYYMFSEDVDWCWRAHKAGFGVVYFPEAVVTHAIGRSTDKAPNRMIGRFHRSMFRFYVKNMVPEMSPVVRPFAIALAAVGLTLRAGVFIVKNKIDVIRRRFRS
jgi:GT2 family glycosyltransferase